MSSTASLTEKNVHQFATGDARVRVALRDRDEPEGPAANLRELIEHARANPGKLSYGSSGTGAASHLSAELFKSMASIDMLHVPYKGTGQAVTDLLAGQIDVMFAPAQTVMPQVQAGKLRALAVTSARRATTLPDLPTAAEAGVRVTRPSAGSGSSRPRRHRASASPHFPPTRTKCCPIRKCGRRCSALGAEPSGNTPEQFARYIRDDQAKWSKLMRERNITAE
jgi:tripartite-type tricarboxylate transporter receptor subunit TctC